MYKYKHLESNLTAFSKATVVCGDGLNFNPKVVGNHCHTHATIILVGIYMNSPNPWLREHHGRGCGRNVRATG